MSQKVYETLYLLIKCDVCLTNLQEYMEQNNKSFDFLCKQCYNRAVVFIILKAILFLHISI